MKATLLSTKPLQKPRNLKNGDMHIDATDAGDLLLARTKRPLDLILKSDRAAARRFAERVIALCDYWEDQQL